VANDVVYNFGRDFGHGDGFTTPSPALATNPLTTSLTSVTATDNFTVVFTFNTPNVEFILESMEAVGEDPLAAPEAVTQWGNLNDWHHAIGTGPFILQDYVSGSSVTLVKNTNYWGYDERYPQNRLPYVDSAKNIGDSGYGHRPGSRGVPARLTLWRILDCKMPKQCRKPIQASFS